VKFDWKQLFDTVQVLGGFAAAAVVLTFFLATVRGCDVVTEQQKTARQAAKAQVYKACIEKSNPPLECRETLKDLY
jgi:hypothetical protein